MTTFTGIATPTHLFCVIVDSFDTPGGCDGCNSDGNYRRLTTPIPTIMVAFNTFETSRELKVTIHVNVAIFEIASGSAVSITRIVPPTPRSLQQLTPSLETPRRSEGQLKEL